MNNKNLWPIGLTVFIIAFLLFSIATVFWAASRSEDLVDEDYYQKGIEYQNEINIRSRTEKLPLKPEIEYSGNRLMIAFPLELSSMLQGGNVHLYRVSDKSLDRDYSLTLNRDGRQIIDASDLKQGNWEIDLTWFMADLQYKMKQDLIIQ